MKITRVIDGETLARLQNAVIGVARETVDARLAERDAVIASLTARVAMLERRLAAMLAAGSQG